MPKVLLKRFRALRWANSALWGMMLQVALQAVTLTPARAGYEARPFGEKWSLCSTEDVEAQVENSPLTLDELSEFVSAHCPLRARILFKTYKKSVLPEINLQIKEHRCVSEDEVSQLLAQKLKTAPKVAGVTIALVSSYILWNWGSSLFPDWLPSQLAFLKPSSPTLQFIGSTVLSAPITLPLSSWLNNKVFGLFKNTAAADPKQDEAVFTMIWRWSQERLTINGQMGRNTLNAAYEGIKSELILLEAQAPGPEDPVARSAFIIQRLAYIMRTNRFLYPDVDPGCFLLALNMPDRLGVYEVDLANIAVKQSVFAVLETIDQDFGQDQVRAYYEKMILAWLPQSMICNLPVRVHLNPNEQAPSDMGETSPLLEPDLL